jgi:hypothetical protein
MKEREILMTEEGVLLLAMSSLGGKIDGPQAAAFREDIIKILMAWRRGRLLPRAEVPALVNLLRHFEPPTPSGGERAAA